MRGDGCPAPGGDQVVPLGREDQERVAFFLRGVAQGALVAAGGVDLGLLRVTAGEWAALGSAFDAIVAINKRIEREACLKRDVLQDVLTAIEPLAQPPDRAVE